MYKRIIFLLNITFFFNSLYFILLSLLQFHNQSNLIFDYLKGKTSWFYSTSTGMGANTFGYIIYFILSPFNLLTLIGGEGNQFFVVNIVFALKLICIGCVAVWFMKKYFKNLNMQTITALAIMYTFSAFVIRSTACSKSAA